ncbi:hypothetical protein BB559_000188 [Furculomyces boomerangus]|uniref:Uncharacterized protein n=1 Tax=Furculomyces boomerangus TaxID=61424 RepID=A0A2T9Z5Z4_9FUNG|nr:hypothetical protein BB559_000188 [Furculomyces boomerangus]
MNYPSYCTLVCNTTNGTFCFVNDDINFQVDTEACPNYFLCNTTDFGSVTCNNNTAVGCKDDTDTPSSVSGSSIASTTGSTSTTKPSSALKLTGLKGLAVLILAVSLSLNL